MKKSEFKKLIKPIVQECVNDVLLKEGLLSNVIAEVVKGLNVKQQIIEQKTDSKFEKKLLLEEEDRRKEKIFDTKKKMLEAIGKQSINGIDIFEGTAPLSRVGALNEGITNDGPLSSVDPKDPGVDISGLMGNKNVWKALLGDKNG